MDFCLLTRGEVELVWTIDRREVIERVYHHENGALVLRDEHVEVSGWPPGSITTMTPLLYECFDRGGSFFAAFDGEQLAGLAVLDTTPLGPDHDLLQLEMLHVGHGYRAAGLGSELFNQARTAAREMGARGLYISAAPSENTVHFYQHHGAILTTPDPVLFAREPGDIHLECPV